MKGWVCWVKGRPETPVNVLADTREQARAIASIELICDYIEVAAYRDRHYEQAIADWDDPVALGLRPR